MSPNPHPSTPSKPHSRLSSRSRSHPQESARDVPYLSQGPEALLLPEGSLSEEAVELLHEFVHPHRSDKRRLDTEDTLVTGDPFESLEQQTGNDETPSEFDSDEENSEKEDWEMLKKRPWYRRPSPLWLLCVTPFSSIAMSACIAPRVEIYTYLACLEHKPEYTIGGVHHAVGQYWNNNTLATVFAKDGYDIPLDGVPFPLLGPNTILNPGIDIAESKNMTRCASDPVVQAAAAQIIAVMTTTMGILSCITTAFWASLSDRYGRLRVVGVSVVGLLFNDFIFISVYFFSRQLPGGYWFLLLGPVIEGMLGGLTSMVAAVHAYLADCSSPGSRSRIFSLGLGLLFIGMAVGPSLGAFLIHTTHTPVSVFYLAAGVHAVFGLYVYCVTPESLPKRAMLANRRRVKERREEERRREENEAREEGDGWRKRILRVLRRLKSVFAFLSPLSVFAPVKVPVTPGAYMGKKKRDWSLTFIAASSGCAGLVMASYQYTFQYAAAMFDWSSEELGYWLSLVGASRAFYLTAILPLIINFFNRPKQAIQLPVEPSEPLIPESSAHLGRSEPSSSTLVSSSFSSPVSSSESPHKPTFPEPSITPHTSAFDLRLARCSLALEVVCYAMIPLAPSAFVFSALGCLAAWGGGFNPAVQALALELYVKRGKEMGEEGEEGEGRRRGRGRGRKEEGSQAETGRLFGAMSVVQAMCQQIFGPSLFGLTYISTVARYPTAIFWVSTLCVSVALVFICSVRLPSAQDARDDHGVTIVVTHHGVGETSGRVGVDAFDLEVGSGSGLMEREATLVDVNDDLPTKDTAWRTIRRKLSFGEGEETTR